MDVSRFCTSARCSISWRATPFQDLGGKHASAGAALVDPLAEQRQSLRRPWLVAWHRLVLQPLVNVLSVVLDVGVLTQVKGEAHLVDVLVAKQGADIALE